MKPEMDASRTAAEWIAEIANADLTPAQRAALADWLRESPLNVQGMIEHALIDQDLRSLSVSREQLEAWTKEARSTAREVIEFEPRRLFRGGGESRVRHTLWTWAASFVLMLGAAASYFWWQADRYSTSLGEQRILTLADGSVVTLNTQSTLKVHFSGDRRAIDLVKGEAFFRVAHDPIRPFEVVAPDATIKAVGTQFNVRLAREATVVSVLDGRVMVSSVDATPVTLDRGEEIRIERPELATPRKPVNAKPTRTAPRAAAWIRGRVEFDNTSLADVIDEFARYRELKVRIEDPTLSELRLTGSFDAHDPQSALAYIATIPGIAVDQDGRGSFVIRRK